jgi:adenine-specific DNA-methyltransferase
VSIDDGELANLLAVMSELFGEENFRANISWQKRYTRSNNTIDFTTVVEHLVVYSKSDFFAVNLLERTKEADARYTNPDNDPRGPWKGASMLNPATPQQRTGLCYPIINPNTGQKTLPTKNAWRRSKVEFDRLADENRLYWGIDGSQPIPAIKMFLSEAREITPINFWDHSYAGNTDDGTRDLRELLGEKIFDNPKPVQLIRRVLEHATEKDSIILDFFAGSGTTAQAVLDQNSADGGTRRFILVQLPERLNPDDSGQAMAANFCHKIGRPLTIAEITKERIRRVGARLREKAGLFSADTGFRVFRLDESNIVQWSASESTLAESLIANVQHSLPDRSAADLLYEVTLKLGIDLCVPVETKNWGGKTIYGIGAGVLFVCLDPTISSSDVEGVAGEIIQWYRECSPAISPTCIFLDSAFEDDVSKLNLTAILEQNGVINIHSI